MIKQTRLLGLSIALLICSACTATGNTSGAQKQNSNFSDAFTQNTMAHLPSQNLNAGECALFLFTSEAPRRFIFFRKASEQTALVLNQSAAQRFAQTKAAGEIIGQFTTLQTYASETHELDVELIPGEKVTDGQRIPSAKLTFRDAVGWEKIIPAQGIRACQPETQT